MDPDIALLERWRAGDKRAGGELFGRYFPDVFTFFDGKVGPPAEELSRRTFSVCEAGEPSRSASTFRTHLFGIVWNELRDHLRREAKADHIDFDQSSLSDLTARKGSPSSDVGRDREAVLRALAQLPVAQQILLEYHFWYGLDPDALAQLFAVSQDTFAERLDNARRALCKQIRRTAPDVLLHDSSDPLTSSLIALEGEERGHS